ncbi:VWA domain-containing protein [Caballeronia sp. S22]|uniref:VWA domain-containing protein n=1 Tax=Caballeronia sp. S22 TaxID=3137182 RepID=UPI0035316A03
MAVHLVCDISGSMSDSGKPFIMRTLVTTVAQWARLGYGQTELTLSTWGAEVREHTDWRAEHECPAALLACEGSSSADALTGLLEANRDDTFLLFTDGFWAQGVEKQLKQWKGCLPPGAFRIVKVGADANPRLKGEHVFAAEDLLAALDGLSGGSPS